MGLKTRPEPPRSFTPEQAAQWFKLIAAIESELGEAGLSNFLFVDGVEGDNATAQRGSLVFKYQTIMGAIAAAQDNDVILINPGVYAEDVVLPPGVENLTIRGSGSASTFITNASAVATVRAVPTVDTVRSITFMDIGIQNTSNLACLLIDGTNDLNLGNAGRVRVQNVLLTTNGALALDVEVCGEMEFLDVHTEQSLAYNQVARVLCSNLYAGDVAVDNDPAGAVPAAGFDGLVVTDGILDNVTVLNLASFAAAEDVQLNDLAGALVDVAAPVGGQSAGSISHRGVVLGDVDVTFDFDDQAGQIPLILDGARMSGSLTFGLAVGGAGGNVARCRALHAKFYDTNAAITANSEAVIDIRGALFDRDALTSADPEVTGTPGTIDRTQWEQVVPSGTNIVGATVTFANGGGNVPYPVNTFDYTVYAECANQLDDVGGWQFGNKLAASVDITGTNGAGATSAGDVRMLVLRTFD